MSNGVVARNRIFPFSGTTSSCSENVRVSWCTIELIKDKVLGCNINLVYSDAISQLPSTDLLERMGGISLPRYQLRPNMRDQGYLRRNKVHSRPLSKNSIGTYIHICAFSLYTWHATYQNSGDAALTPERHGCQMEQANNDLQCKLHTGEYFFKLKSTCVQKCMPHILLSYL